MMANSQINFSDLKDGHCRQFVVTHVVCQVRKLRFTYFIKNAEDHPHDDMTGDVNLSMDSNPITLDNTNRCDATASIEGCSEVSEPIPPKLIH
ncbi:hypothetical protein HID58_014069 [Brassica napus]|uniref:Uncharacterized protein n=1 Tax=Brassica napus TaxID=3708 RepID=A0ABQ8DH33_BRANA|nr:hypothetical protein HID58_014069 [Brassica napus]